MLLVRPAKASTNTAVVQVVVVFRRTVLHCQGVSLFHEAVGLEDLDQRERLKKLTILGSYLHIRHILVLVAVDGVPKELLACGEDGATNQNRSRQPAEVGWLPIELKWLQDTNFARVNVALEMSIASALDLKNCFSPPKAA